MNQRPNSFANSAFSDTPVSFGVMILCAVIFLTGYADRLTIERANELNPSGYILKPVSEEELRKNLAAALD